jgi:filamentous hemagglutinin family protein
MYRSLNRLRRRGGQIFTFTYALAASAVAAANPRGAEVVHGAASFATPNPHTLEITNSPSAILNWQSFNIGAAETTRFIQESAASAVLNRVVGGSSSEILGNLLSNGRVFLINEAGILIGRDATIDTAGLVMSTLDIQDADFLGGRLHFEGDADNGGITNHGYIKSAPGSFSSRRVSSTSPRPGIRAAA